EVRHHIAYAYTHGYPGRKMMTTDVCVPISKLAAAIRFARTQIEETGLEGGVIGHVGDGNFHAMVMFDTNSEDEVARATKFNENLVEFALSQGGTCTGEHGVGIGKSKYQQKEHGAALQVMKAIKVTLDPNNIMNPGKIFID
ncbi:2-hydroxy-acid oxidase, partial [Butyricicoccus sp. 1XD8-22]